MGSTSLGGSLFDLDAAAAVCIASCSFSVVDLMPGYLGATFLGVEEFGAADGVGLIQAINSSFQFEYFGVLMSALPTDLTGAVLIGSLVGEDVTGFDVNQINASTAELVVSVRGSVKGYSAVIDTTPVPIASTDILTVVGLALLTWAAKGFPMPRATHLVRLASLAKLKLSPTASARSSTTSPRP